MIIRPIEMVSILTPFIGQIFKLSQAFILKGLKLGDAFAIGKKGSVIHEFFHKIVIFVWEQILWPDL